LGLSSFHKGFKCLDPNTGRVYILRDVMFGETVVSFDVLRPNAGHRLQEEILFLSPNLLNLEVVQLHDNVANGYTNPATNSGAS
jgi:hypothetical protein